MQTACLSMCSYAAAHVCLHTAGLHYDYDLGDGMKKSRCTAVSAIRL